MWQIYNVIILMNIHAGNNPYSYFHKRFIYKYAPYLDLHQVMSMQKKVLHKRPNELSVSISVTAFGNQRDHQHFISCRNAQKQAEDHSLLGLH